MKVVTYNVNGLRQRVLQFGCLRKLLDSFDADIICFQETKLRRQEITADLVNAEGYESFISCTRTHGRGRAGYSGVATFCRVRSAYSSTEVSLPVDAEEGFTGFYTLNDGESVRVQGMENYTEDELWKVDSEGRCIITDHDHFVLFNIYGPRAGNDDAERINFKLKFYEILQKRWDTLLHQGRRILVVGDLNIAPFSIDCCEADPEFENNMFRRWFRSLLVDSGGAFLDAFRVHHSDRKDAYTCWPSNTGAEQFNFGTRIDHILCAGSCFHEEKESTGHHFATCAVEECDILTDYKRVKTGITPRWNGGWGTKLDGSDHVPVYVKLSKLSDVVRHDTPSLSTRYLPVVHGRQQTIGSILMKRKSSSQDLYVENGSSFFEESTILNENPVDTTLQKEAESKELTLSPCSIASTSSVATARTIRKVRGCSQLSLRSFFTQNGSSENRDKPDVVPVQQAKEAFDDCWEDGENYKKNRNSEASKEWQRIQEMMQNSIPRCKGHKEPCTVRVVKKPGPTCGRRFYVCPRAEQFLEC